MQGVNLAEQGHIVSIFSPVDIAGGKTGQRFKMMNHIRAAIIVAIGVSASAFTKIVINAADARSGGSKQAIPFALYAQETSNGDVPGARTAVAATGHAPSANDNIFYVIDLNARELPDGKPWVELELTNGSNSVIASAIAILTGARYAHAGSETVLS